MRHAALIMAIMLLGVTRTQRLAAQTPAERLALTHFRDSLRDIHDTTALRLIEHRLHERVSAQRSDALSALRLGFTQLRLGEVQQRTSPFGDAENTFNDVIAAHPDWDVAWLGHDLARASELDDHGAASRDGLREHDQRLDEARTAFALPAPYFRADAVVSSVVAGHEMDERGAVWVLHGRPDHRTHLSMVSVPPNESWQYKLDDGGELLFRFVKTDDARGYRRVPSLLDILATLCSCRDGGARRGAANVWRKLDGANGAGHALLPRSDEPDLRPDAVAGQEWRAGPAAGRAGSGRQQRQARRDGVGSL